MLSKTALSMKTVTFTPAEAEKILETKALKHNRPIRQSWVETLAAEMKAKKWKLNGETIKFTREGDLLDGHHRMWACEEAGVPFTTAVMYDVDVDSFDTIDVVRPKNGADMLFSNGTHKYYKPLSTAVGLILRYNSGKIMYKKKLMPREITTYFDNHTDLETWVEAASKAEIRPYAAPVAAVVYLGGAVRHRAKAAEFVAKLVSGANLPPGSPILALRNRLLSKGAIGSTRDSQAERFALCIQAWNAFMENRELKRMQIFVGDKFPKIRGATL